MFAAKPRSTDAMYRSQNTVLVTISEHAQEQWDARMETDIPLTTAWENGIPVEPPEADSTAARLYPPCDALLVVKDGTVTTVLHNDGRLNTSGLIECQSCTDVVDPLTAEACPWCGAEISVPNRPGCVTISRGDL